MSEPVPAGPPAGSVLRASLETRRGGRLVRTARQVGFVATGLVQGLVPAPSLADLVVRRQDDEVEVMRIPAGDPFAAPDLLAHVEDQLRTQTVGQFCDAWDLPASPTSNA